MNTEQESPEHASVEQASLPFPAVIKTVHADAGEISMTLDISPPDIAFLVDLIDQEIAVSISAAPAFQPQGAPHPTEADESTCKPPRPTTRPATTRPAPKRAHR